MAIQRVRSGAVYGIDGYDVMVEVDARRGLPTFQIVGLPGTTLRESRERVLSAMRNSGLDWPAGRVTVNLAPADVRKQGAAVDVAIAVGVSACTREDAPPPPERREAVLLGELSLGGELRPVRGLLSIVTAAAARGARVFVVPATQAWEARLVPGIDVLAARDLAQVAAWHRTGEGLHACPDAGEPAREPEAPRDAVAVIVSSPMCSSSTATSRSRRLNARPISWSRRSCTGLPTSLTARQPIPSDRPPAATLSAAPSPFS